MKAKKKGISLCMIAKDEERCIADCINSVNGVVDEVIVVDTGSSDRTAEIAASLGAAVISFEWTGSFADARNFALSHGNYEWALVLDADERLEGKDKHKIAELTELKSCDGAHFRVLNYIGTSEKNRRYTVHNALRLVRNDGRYLFVGAIHEQIARADGKAVRQGAFLLSEVRLHHSGYLDGVVKAKSKRERNMPLLMAQHEREPEDAFVMFNIGNEYMADSDYTKAAEWYTRAEALAPVEQAFTPHLYYRSALTRYGMGDYQAAVDVAGRGLRLYAACTDLVVLKGRVLKDWRKNLRAAECFELALKMGDPPPALKFSDGCGTVVPLTELALLYEREGDYNHAIEYYTQALKNDSANCSALYRIGDIFKRLKLTAEQTEANLNQFFGDVKHPPNAVIIADILLNCGHTVQAQAVAEGLPSAQYPYERAMLMCRAAYYCGDLVAAQNHALVMLKGLNEPNIFAAYAEAAAVLAAALVMSVGSSEDKGVQAATAEAWAQAYGKLGAKIFARLIELKEGGKDNILQAIDGREAISLAEKVLIELLRAQDYDTFENMLYIYNCTDSKDVLLSLAGVYMDAGLDKFAVENVLRSVKELDRITLPSAYMLAEAWAANPQWVFGAADEHNNSQN